MSHRLLILGSLDEFVQLVKRAKERDYYVVVCDGYEHGPAKLLADSTYNIKVNNVEDICSVCFNEKIDGIIGSFSDVLFEEITRIADMTSLKWYVKPSSLTFYRNKYEAKSLLKKIGVRVPKFTILSKDFTDDMLFGYNFPLVIKPINGYGSKGIQVVSSILEIHNKFDEVATRFYSDKILVEEYINGHEYNMMAWVIDGEIYVISIADREKNPQKLNKVPLVNRIVYPSKRTYQVFNHAKDILKRFVAKTGQKEGPISMQFFSDNKEITVCEIAGRLLGYEHELVTYCSGLDLENLLLDYVYEPDNVKKTLQHHDPFFNKNCAGLYYVADHGEIVTDLSVAKKLQNESHVIDSMIYYKEGETVNNYSYRPYFARYYICAENRNMLDTITKYFFSEMKVSSRNKENIIEPLFLEGE